MHLTDIVREVEALQKAGYLRTGADSDEIVKFLRNACWADRGAVIWTTEDVTEHARSMGVALTPAGARDVLQRTLQGHNADVGIRWESFEPFIREMASQNKPIVAGPQRITARNGWEFEVQGLTEGFEKEEAPFRLVRTNGRPPFRGRAYRLLRNKPQPELCFPIPEGSFMAERPLNIWFKINPQGQLQAVL